jgi:hypothetical protein
MMKQDARAPAAPGDLQRLDPMALTMDIAARLQTMTAAFAAAQAGAAQRALDRLAAYGSQIAEARHPLAVMAIQMECCASLLDAAAAPFKAAAQEIPELQASIPGHAPAVQPPAGQAVRAGPADKQVTQRPPRTGDSYSASGQLAPAQRSE